MGVNICRNKLRMEKKRRNYYAIRVVGFVDFGEDIESEQFPHYGDLMTTVVLPLSTG
jgi:hypothetical protein